MKTRVLLALLSVFTLASVALPAQAADDDSLLFGQNHAYSAIVRADGKVITHAKIYLDNQQGGNLRETSFTVPEGVSVSNITAYQIMLPERCKDATTENDKPAAGLSYPYYPRPQTCDELSRKAFVFDDDRYYYYSDDSLGLLYKKIDLSSSDRTYTVKLPEAIKPSDQGAYLVSYVAEKGYVSGLLGLYNLSFSTLQVPQSVNQVRVAVDVASDFYTKEERSEIKSGGSIGIQDGANAASGESKALDTLQSSIGTGGTFSKSGKGLLANESFVVNGQFADAAWKLHLWTILGVGVGLIALIAVAIVMLKKASHQPAPEAKGVRKNGRK